MDSLTNKYAAEDTTHSDFSSSVQATLTFLNNEELIKLVNLSALTFFFVGPNDWKGLLRPCDRTLVGLCGHHQRQTRFLAGTRFVQEKGQPHQAQRVYGSSEIVGLPKGLFVARS